MISNARGSHSSPGIYTKEVDLSYASKSLGITTLGVVGETLKGPAFEPIKIENWKEFQEYFGGTSTEKFMGSQYPKYELPYIAKSYLKNSNHLEVCRVLGLSGYNAGPAWLITLTKGKYKKFTDTPNPTNAAEVTEMPTKKVAKYISYSNQYYVWSEDETAPKYVIGVLRSRGEYNMNGDAVSCTTTETKYNTLSYLAKNVYTKNYTSATEILQCPQNANTNQFTTDSYEVDATNYGKFTLMINEVPYPVSLNPSDKDYIVNILGSKVYDANNTAPLFVEELYDVALQDLVKSGEIFGVTAIQKHYTVYGEKPQGDATKNDVGREYVALEEGSVKLYTAKETAQGEEHTYAWEEITGSTVTKSDHFYFEKDDTFKKVQNDTFVNCDEERNVRKEYYDYKESFRCASTPWIVSELKGNGSEVEVKKLFRFHTISDGNASNHEVKISIQNIRPDEGLFDVIVRAFDDADSSPIVLERFTKCSMVPGTNNFIGFKIGTFDGEYVVKSKYITVEVIANVTTQLCVPAGFLGYPIRSYTTSGMTNAPIGYNIDINDDINAKKQYFGFSSRKGIDEDLFKYKGRNSYNNIDALTEGFHLDSYINYTGTGDTKTSVRVNGQSGYKFISVSSDVYPGVSGGKSPRLGSDSDMTDTIYENINYRKFTVCFYGGFDGWDVYRNSRTNTDEFKANKYKGVIGADSTFSEIIDAEAYNLSGKCITSDYYAYLAGIRQFMNPEAVDINVFATPGIDYVNNKYLSQEALSMIEEERGDCLYVMTTPDKAFGSDDKELLYPAEVVDNLYGSEIDSSYATTYYPWVKYYDADNKSYINLPVTKDVVSSLAYTDSTSYPWFAPAGIIRGGVECEKAHYITKLEDEDMLYEGLINPVKTFATDGVKIWGQKTMYTGDTPLNRVNVRRLMLRVKKLITGACRRLIFEQNDTTVKSQFEGLVRPILDDIKSKRGIYDYKLEVQDSAEARDRMELPAVIYIKPTKALEYIDLTFVIMPESAKFDE